MKNRFEKFFIRIPITGCWLWEGGAQQHGYGKFTVKGKPRWAHRVAWELYKGPIPKGLSVLHKCDVPACVNPDHLFLGTAKDNVHDAIAKKRMNYFLNRKRGEDNGNSKLTKEKVLAILADERSHFKIAIAHGLHRDTVMKIKHRTLWKHVTQEMRGVGI